MKTVLVSGGAGFIGSHLCDRLLLRTDIQKLVVVDSLWTGLLENIEHIKDPRFHFVKSDVETLQTSDKFDEIYHLASPRRRPGT